MCKFCVEHGAGKKWYLQMDNYSKEAMERAKTEEWYHSYFKTAEKVIAENMKMYGNALGKPKTFDQIRSITERVLHEDGDKGFPSGGIGQVITTGEAKAILHLAEPIAVMSCSCKLAFRGIKTPSCLMFGIIGEIAEKYPAYTPKGVEYLSPKEGEDLIEKFCKQGLVHSIWFHPKPFIGMLCNCGCQDCVPIKNRLTFGTQGIYKGHYVAKVDPNKCIGCQAMSCKSRCIFGALYWNPTIRHTQIDMANCFGCGLCIQACPENAISLLSREEILGLKDMW